ncbi:hypothetical protein [Deinococcus deserti]|uniref:Uncharacterized protein n=1 Tax=Deinococcus deserti (strain DSM 17065 / CIP 109153 / LMG 22923 / VCD115) TaxID=546414 RepID=C1CVP6_DEIDV|nr:hypothetical protein [Deinococcus deserti]ACO46263.1 Conserved hypothetical protein, precursor [Deinococcus deserti VCD115]
MPQLSSRRALSFSLLLGSMLLSAAPAHAQTGGILPLVSVGQKWPQAQETYVIQVSPQDAGKPLNLEVFSPTLNLADYADGRRGEGYFGDELYKTNEPFESIFTLSGPGGLVAERRYAANRAHTWESLFAGGLNAGTYTLKVSSKGDGKNSFALRVSAPFSLETSDFSVNARDTEQTPLLAARLNVPASWVGKTFSVLNYDLDGPREAETWLVRPGGARVDLAPSDNGKTATDRVTVTADMVGEWQLFIRVLPTTRQYSNAVRYSFRLGDQPTPARVGGFTPPADLKISNQLLVDVVDPQGRPVPGASYALIGETVVRPVLPPGYVPVSSSIIQGTGNIVSPSEVRYQTGFNKIRFVVRPPEGQLTVDAVAIYGDQRLPLTGVPFEVAGRTLTTPATLPLAPGDYPVKPGALPGSTFVQPLPGRVPDAGTGRVTLEYRVQTELTLITSPDLLNACDVTQLTAIAKTAFPFRLPSRLKLNLPAGWTSDYPLEIPGEFTHDQPLRLKVPVRVCRSDTAEAVLDPAGLRTTGQTRVRNPGGANVTRSVQGGARATLAKSVEAGPQGYVVTLVLTVDSTLENVRLIDPLPGTSAIRGTLGVQGPSLANLNARVDGNIIVLSRVIPGTYTLTYPLTTDVPADQVVTVPDLNW